VQEPSIIYPIVRPVADHAILVEFGDVIDRAVNDRVRDLDAALAAHPFEGFTEAVPAYTSVLIGFDPLITSHSIVEGTVADLLSKPARPLPATATRDVLVCYDDDFGPDLSAVADATGLSREAVIAAHLAGDYRVFLYGFAPGYAYMAGVPPQIQLPRKKNAIRDIAAGSVVIAGPQCLVTTLIMPTGWWIIGRSPTRILRTDAVRPFLFDVGDNVTFRRIDRSTFDAEDRRT
jgi:inhibitor of KinA